MSMEKGEMNKRALRLLSLLRKHARLPVTQNENGVLARIPGERTLRFSGSDIAPLLSAGLVCINRCADGLVLQLTEAGRQAAAARQPLTGSGTAPAAEVDVAILWDGGAASAVVRNRAESPLDALSRTTAGRAAWLSGDELQAGERLRRDFEASGMAPRISASWDAARLAGRNAPSRNHQADCSDFAADAGKRFSTAVEAIGPELAGVVVDVCCFLKGLETVERERQWPRRSAKLMLKTGLSVLARHYAPDRPQGRRRSHRWGAEGYRPSLGR